MFLGWLSRCNSMFIFFDGNVIFIFELSFNSSTVFSNLKVETNGLVIPSVSFLSLTVAKKKRQEKTPSPVEENAIILN